jgi:hypothetical protein
MATVTRSPATRSPAAAHPVPPPEERRRRDIGCNPWTGRDRRAARPAATALAPPLAPPSRPVVTEPRRDRDNPTIWEALRVDPTLHVPLDRRELQFREQQRWTRHVVRPVVRVIAMVVIHAALFLKRLVPFRLGSERALNWLGPRFMRRCASPEALAYVLRHFVIESNLINFVARNAGADDVLEVALRPTCADDLADDGGLNAVVRHDANIFNLVIDLGESPTADIHTPRALTDLDFSMLTIPVFDVEAHRRRWIALDIESALHITVAALALFMDGATAERAVNSFQLDESLLACLANLTGDDIFRTWTPVKFPNWLGMTNNVGRDLHWHMIVNEYAHERLRELAMWADDARRVGA